MLNFKLLTKSIIILFIGINSAVAQDKKEFGGTIEAVIDGKVIYFPLLKSQINADIHGDLATVKITQIFENPSPKPIHAKYLFPMNKDSAVFAMTMTVGDRVTNAVIKRKEEARRTFEQAKSQGKSASLLTQHRPNMFTQNVANLMPGVPIEITISYSQVVPKIDGDYELVVPLIVGPRYQSPSVGYKNAAMQSASHNASEESFGTWELEKLPEYPLVNGVTLPETIDAERVSINAKIHSDLKIANIYSDSHFITTDGNDKQKSIALRDGSVIDNRDFILRYALSGSSVQAGFLSTVSEEGNGYFSLLIEPPAMPKDEQITRREMVFVLDTSGSMRGEPLDASKTFMRHALNNLRSGDYFRIISFNNSASEYSDSPQLATQQNISRGLDFINNLHGGGGTEIGTSIHQAFSTAPEAGTVRIVVFLTDGYIGYEQTVYDQIDDMIGDARIYAFGVGSSVNRYLLSEMGRRGRGFARFIDPTEKSNDVAISLATKLNAPVLTNISLEFGDMEVSDLTPAVIPDLFAGDSIRVQGKFTGSGQKTISINGLVTGHKASLPLQVTLADDSDQNREALPIIWARSMVADKMRAFSAPDWRRDYQFDQRTVNNRLKQDIIDLGLNHSLVTQWTSFVAVDEKIVNKKPEDTQTTSVPLPKVAGVENSAYGEKKPRQPAKRQRVANLASNVARFAPKNAPQEYMEQAMVAAAPAPAPLPHMSNLSSESDALVVAGSRVKGRTALDSNVPAEVVMAADLTPTPSLNLKDSLGPTIHTPEMSTTIAHLPSAATPEPGTIGGLAVLSALGFFALRRRKKG